MIFVATSLPAAKLAAVTRNPCTGAIYGAWTADAELSSVAAALWQTWNDKSWQTVAEIAKPPLLNFESSAEADFRQVERS